VAVEAVADNQPHRVEAEEANHKGVEKKPQKVAVAQAAEVEVEFFTAA
jgi:hypothetical protein